MKVVLSTVMLALSIFLWSSSAEASRVVGKDEFFEPEEGRSLVYFIRPWAFGGSAATTFIFIGDQLVTTVDNGTYTALHLDPGEHILNIALQFQLKSEKSYLLYRMQVEADTEYFLLWRFNKRTITLVEQEEGRALVLQERDRVEATEKERERAARVIARLQKQRYYSWSPEMFDVVTEFAKFQDYKATSKEDLIEFVRQRRLLYNIPEGSLGEIYAIAQIADLVGNTRLASEDFDAAGLFFGIAIGGYLEAATRFEHINKQLRKKKWAGVLGNALFGTLGSMSSRPMPLQVFDVNSTTLVKKVCRQEAEKIRKFEAEASRRISCINTSAGNAAISICLETPSE